MLSLSTNDDYIGTPTLTSQARSSQGRKAPSKLGPIASAWHSLYMAFRAAEFGDLCSECKTLTQSRCLRCGKPLCGQHSPAPQARCDSCEAEFDARCKPMIDAAILAVSEAPAPQRRRAWLLLGGTAAVVSGLSIFVSTDVFFALLLAVPMAFLGGVEASRTFAEQVYRHRLLQERTLRRQFLAERKPHLRLEAPKAMVPAASQRKTSSAAAPRGPEPNQQSCAFVTAAF